MKKILGIISAAMLMCFISLSASADEPYKVVTGGASMDKATEISMNQEYAAKYNNGETVYYKFTTPNQKGYVDYYSKNINVDKEMQGAFNVIMVNSLDEVLTRHDYDLGIGPGAEFRKNIAVSPNTTYYVKVFYRKVKDDFTTSGNYKFSITYSADDNEDVVEKATPIKLNEEKAAALESDFDKDAFSFTTGSESKYVLDASRADTLAGNAVRYTIYNEIGETKAQIKMGYNIDEKTSHNEFELYPNTKYYVVVDTEQYFNGARRGSYSFKLYPYVAPTATPVPTEAPEVNPQDYKISNGDTVQYIGKEKVKTKEVNLPDTVTLDGKEYKLTAIAPNAFKNNKKIKVVRLGKNIKSIGDNAFAGCTNLRSITIASNVTSIGKNAFKGDKKLSEIIVESKKLVSKKVAKGAFSGIAKKVTIQVPTKKLKSYKKIFKKAVIGSKIIYKTK